MSDRLLSAVAICALVFSACGSSAQPSGGGASPAPATQGPAASGVPPSASQGGATAPTTLRYTRLADTDPHWHPVQQQTGNQMTMWQLVYNTLVKVKADETTLVPDLADSWEASADATQYTFHLHPGVKWQDGTPFTSKDVVYTINFAVQNADSYKGYPPTAFWEIKGAAAVKGTTNTPEGLTAPDDNTVKITLAAPDAEFLRSLPDAVYSILPEHILKGVTAADVEKVPFTVGTPGTTIGTGPYALTKFQYPDFAQFAANPDYFKGKPKIDQIIMKFYSKPELALSDLEGGALDLALILSPNDQARLDKVANLKTQFIPSVAIYAVLFNGASVTDKRVRQAAYYAINRAEIVKSVLNGQARVLIAPPGFKEYSDLNRFDFSPDKAKQLLKDAGYDASKPLKWSYDQSQPNLATLMPIFQQQLQAVGFNVVLDPLDTTAYIAKVTSQPDQWDITMQIGNSEGLGPARTGDELPANCKTHPWGYANCNLDAAFASGRSTTDPAARDNFYHQAALILNDEQPELYLWSPFNLHAYPKKLGGGFEIHPNDRETMMNVETWTLTP